MDRRISSPGWPDPSSRQDDLPDGLVHVSSAALATCASEPIHIPATVQRRGVMLARDASGRISHVSENAPRLLACASAEELLGRSLEDALGPEIAEFVDASLGEWASPGARVRKFAVVPRGREERVHVTAHRLEASPTSTVVEIEPAQDGVVSPPLELVQAVLGRLQRARTLRELCQTTADEIRGLIGFDRVMIYRFLEDGSGQVIAEAKAAKLSPLLGLRYPESDIPAQARVLYAKSWVRLIDDVKGTPSRLLSERSAGALDMTHADLRAVSPVHIEYLVNMGVAASMSISILVGDQLWGLIACHHMQPRVVDASLRAAADLLGQVFSLQVQTVESTEEYVTMRAGRMLLDRVISELPIGDDVAGSLSARLEQLAAFVPCDGAGLLVEDEFRGTGLTPEPREVVALGRHVTARSARGVFATHAIGAELPDASSWSSGVCGVLAVPLSERPGNWLFFFRRAVAQTVTWGGNPDKLLVHEDGRIGPRKSFEAWKTDVQGQSRPWTSRERHLGDALRVYLLDIVVRFGDVLREERRRAEQRTRLVRSELNHRVRGTLELIQSLVVHGYAAPSGLREFVRALQGRVEAIALAHDATSLGEGVSLRALVERAVARHPHAAATLQIDGPDVKLHAKPYTVVALVVHELATAAAATGAFAAGGKLAVRWSCDAEGRLVLRWMEVGRVTEAPRGEERDELGSIIVRRNIPHALDGEAHLEEDASGVRATFVIPASCLLPERDDAATATHATPRPGLPFPARSEHRPPPLEGYDILVVEDQIATALDLERLLRERGAANVRTVGTVASAVAAIAARTPDVALVDVDLGDEGDATPILEALAATTTPYVLAVPPDGRGAERDPDAPRVTTPYEGEVVVDLLKEALLTRLIRAVLTQLD